MTSISYSGIFENEVINTIAKANSDVTQKYLYVIKADYIESGSNTDIKQGQTFNINVDFASNSITFDKDGWFFGNEEGDTDDYTKLFDSANYMSYSSPTYEWIKPIKGSSATLSYFGSQLFSFLSGGIKLEGYVNGTNVNGVPTPSPANFIVESKTPLNGNSCGFGSRTVYEFQVYSNTVNPSLTLGFNEGDTFKVSIDEKTNAITTEKLNWGVADFYNQTYSQFDKWFLSDSSPLKMYKPNSDSRDMVFYFDKKDGVLSEYGANKFKEMGIGFASISEGVTGYREYTNYPIKYNRIFYFMLKNKSQEQIPCETTSPTLYPTTCTEGLIPKGTPGTNTFYCEKPVKLIEKEFVGADSINLENIMGDYGSSGDRTDGQFTMDYGSHSTGWFLNGSGEDYKSNHIQFTNVPDNGYINAIGNSWQPQYLITQGKNKIQVSNLQNNPTEEQKREQSLSNFKNSNSFTEVIAYKVTDLDALKVIQDTDKGFINLFSKTGTNYTYDNQIVSHKIDSDGETDYSELTVTNSGYYILGTKYVDMLEAKKETPDPKQDMIDKHTYYSFVAVNVNFVTDLGYLPIHNNLLTQVNNDVLVIGNQKTNHKLANLTYQTYKSMKVPSAYNYSNSKTLIGSTSGGLQLLNKELTPIAIVDNTSTINTVKINDIIEYDNGFYIATDIGILYLNCEDDTLNKTMVIESVNDLEVYYNNLYTLTDNRLIMLFANGKDLIESAKNYNLTDMFSNPSTKAGRVEVLGGLLTVSSKDDSAHSEIITLSK